MNKSQIREFLGNLKAATRLGHIDAVDLALDSLRAHPVVAANDHLSEGQLSKLILPAGEILSRLPADHLLFLLEEPLAALRAAGAAALGKRYLIHEDVNRSMLLTLAKDQRPEVRTALGEALREVDEAHPERFLHLMESWLGDSTPKVRATALIVLPVLTSSYGEKTIKMLEPLKDDEDRDVRAALAKALGAIAQNEYADSILDMLTNWSAERYPSVWVITRTISGSWAASHPKKVEVILRNLHAKFGESKYFTNALRALERHGATIDIE